MPPSRTRDEVIIAAMERSRQDPRSTLKFGSSKAAVPARWIDLNEHCDGATIGAMHAGTQGDGQRLEALPYTYLHTRKIPG